MFVGVVLNTLGLLLVFQVFFLLDHGNKVTRGLLKRGIMLRSSMKN